MNLSDISINTQSSRRTEFKKPVDSDIQVELKL